MCRGNGWNAVASGKYRSTASLKAQPQCRELMLSPANGCRLEQEVNNGYHHLQREYDTKTSVPCIQN